MKAVFFLKAEQLISVILDMYDICMEQIALSQLTGVAQMCFYVLMTYATYIGNSNFGILVGVTGIIITVSRMYWRGAL